MKRNDRIVKNKYAKCSSLDRERIVDIVQKPTTENKAKVERRLSPKKEDASAKIRDSGSRKKGRSEADEVVQKKRVKTGDIEPICGNKCSEVALIKKGAVGGGVNNEKSADKKRSINKGRNSGRSIIERESENTTRGATGYVTEIKSEESKKELCLESFAGQVYPSFSSTRFHTVYYRVLEHFARGDIRRLIVSVPPQHGKSFGASILLPAYLLGLNPDCKIALASYNAMLASRFNRRVQRIMDSKAYSAIFPESAIKPLAGRLDAIRTANQFEVIGRRGELLSVGREGSLTGNEVDIFILDDLYKDAMEANSPVIRDNCWEWYTAVVRSRMHNDSQELIVFTRWHEEDLIGSILAKESHTILNSWSDIESLDAGRWLVVNFEALKESPATEIDPRGVGEALWSARHSKELLLSKRNLDAFWFNCMYQGRPSMIEGLLYFDRFELYAELPVNPIKRANYTDTADMGDDYLCSVCYDVSNSGEIYITDVVYSRQPMEITEGLVAQMLERNLTRHSYIESNNGGRGFARAVGKLVPHVRIEWFHQGQNKEARILTNSSTVLHSVRMPARWAELWPEFYNHLVSYRRLYGSNRWHDAPDVLTGIVQREIVDVVAKRVVVY